MLKKISGSVKAEMDKRAKRSLVCNALSYMLDPGRIDEMKRELGVVLGKFHVCSHIPFTTIHVR